jgi:probable HAF family extracellular repeat protein
VTGGSATARDFYGHAFLYNNGTMQDLGTFPGGSTSYGYGISASGEVTGYSYTRDRAIHAFLYRNARMIGLNSQISSTDAQIYTLTSGRAINDKGQIVVNATVNATGVSAALLLTPTTENPAEKGDDSSRLLSQ